MAQGRLRRTVRIEGMGQRKRALRLEPRWHREGRTRIEDNHATTRTRRSGRPRPGTRVRPDMPRGISEQTGKNPIAVDPKVLPGDEIRTDVRSRARCHGGDPRHDLEHIAHRLVNTLGFTALCARTLLRAGPWTHIGVAAFTIAELANNLWSPDARLANPLAVTVLVAFTEGRRRTSDDEATTRATRNAIVMASVLVAMEFAFHAIASAPPILNDTSTYQTDAAFVWLLAAALAAIVAVPIVQRSVCQAITLLYAVAGAGERPVDAMLKSMLISSNEHARRSGARYFALSWMAAIALDTTSVYIFDPWTSYLARDAIDIAHCAFIAAIAIVLWTDPLEPRTKTSRVQAHALDSAVKQPGL